jgi:uncharacterized protein (TIGR00661 family)
MRILYGVQGTGNGHLARARSLVPALRKAGIALDILFSGRLPEDFFHMELFENYQCKRGLTLVVESGRLNQFKTVTQNNPFEFLRDVLELNLSSYDLVISDFEPITAWAAKLKKVPSIGISHQCAFHCGVPKVSGFLGSRLLMKYFAPTKENIGLHWHHFNQPILPPLIESHSRKKTQVRKILVYMGFEDIEDVVDFLSPFPEFDFYVFSKQNSARDLRHIRIHPLSHAQFHRHLEDCSGVISNAGFELASECLSLGKKLLIRPLSGQYEQLSNGLALQAMKRATVMSGLDKDMLRDWLLLPHHQPVDYPDVASVLAQWLLEPERRSVEELADQLWNELFLPYSYDNFFGDELVPNLVV